MEGQLRTGADALVEGLAAAGVRHVFGLPGDTGMDLYDSFCRVGGSVGHIMCRDERHAAIMADVYARCTSTVGVVEVSSGGGATFCIGGLGEAFAASIPVLVISSDIQANSRNTGALTEIDQEQLFSAVTKWARRAESADDIPELLREAIETAASGRPAPVVLIVPENVLQEKTAVPVGRIDSLVPAARPPADPQLVAAVAGALLRAERPAIVCGGAASIPPGLMQSWRSWRSPRPCPSPRLFTERAPTPSRRPGRWGWWEPTGRDPTPTSTSPARTRTATGAPRDPRLSRRSTSQPSVQGD